MNYPENINDLVIIGAYHFETGFRNFNPWSELMIKQFGKEVKPYLDKVWEESQIYYNRELANKKTDFVVAQKLFDNKTTHDMYNHHQQKITLSDIKKSFKEDFGFKRLKCLINNILLPKIVLSVGMALIALRLFFPPRYCINDGGRIPYDRYFLSEIRAPDFIHEQKGFCEFLGLHLDFHTSLLDSLGIAIITGISFYLLKDRKPK